MIGAFYYTSLLVYYDVPPNSSLNWILLIGYLVGIEVAIIGFTLHARMKAHLASNVNKTIFSVGFILLTLGVFGFLFDRIFAALNATYPFSIHSLLVRLLIVRRVGWLTSVCACLGFVGGFLLLISKALSPMQPRGQRPSWKKHEIGFYLLAIGAVIMLTVTIVEFTSLLSMTIFVSLYPWVYALFAFAVPLGILGLTLGWAAAAAKRFRKTPFLLPIAYAVFLAAMLGLYFVPI